MCQKTWKGKIITKIYLFSELYSLCCEFLALGRESTYNLFECELTRKMLSSRIE